MYIYKYIYVFVYICYMHIHIYICIKRLEYATRMCIYTQHIARTQCLCVSATLCMPHCVCPTAHATRCVPSMQACVGHTVYTTGMCVCTVYATRICIYRYNIVYATRMCIHTSYVYTYIQYVHTRVDIFIRSI